MCIYIYIYINYDLLLSIMLILIFYYIVSADTVFYRNFFVHLRTKLLGRKRKETLILSSLATRLGSTDASDIIRAIRTKISTDHPIDNSGFRFYVRANTKLAQLSTSHLVSPPPLFPHRRKDEHCCPHHHAGDQHPQPRGPQ